MNVKSKKRIYIPDSYVGFLALPVIGLIAIITDWALPWVTAIINFFHHK